MLPHPEDRFDSPIDFIDEGVRLAPGNFNNTSWEKRLLQRLLFHLWSGNPAFPAFAGLLNYLAILCWPAEKLAWLLDPLGLVALYFFARWLLSKRKRFFFTFVFIFFGWSGDVLAPRYSFVIASLALFFCGLEIRERKVGRTLLFLGGTSLGAWVSFTAWTPD